MQIPNVHEELQRIICLDYDNNNEFSLVKLKVDLEKRILHPVVSAILCHMGNLNDYMYLSVISSTTNKEYMVRVAAETHQLQTITVGIGQP